MYVNGEGIFGSRPWMLAGEGSSSAAAGAFKEAVVAWSAQDFRFTRKAGTLFAFQMRWPEDHRAAIRALSSKQARRVVGVRLLGYGNVAFEQTEEALQITLPAVTPIEGPHGFAIVQD